MALTQSSIGDQTKNDTIDSEQTQNNNVSSDEESFVSSASKSISKTRSQKSTPTKTAKRKSNEMKDLPDENENCRVSIFDINLKSRLYENDGKLSNFRIIHRL